MPIPKNWAAPKVQKNNKDFLALPADVYQVFVEDVDIVQTKAYQSEELIWQLKFKFRIMEKPYENRRIWKYATPVISYGSETRNPSNFNLIYEAVFCATPHDNEINNVDAHVVNSFIGKQLRLTLRIATNKDGKETNKIDSFLPAKVQLPMPDDWKIPEPKEHVEGYDIPVLNRPSDHEEVDFGSLDF